MTKDDVRKKLVETRKTLDDAIESHNPSKLFQRKSRAGVIALIAAASIAICTGAFYTNKYLDQTAIIERFQRDNPAVLSQIFKGEHEVTIGGVTYQLDKIQEPITYSTNREKGAILYLTQARFSSEGLGVRDLYVFNTKGPLNFKRVTESLPPDSYRRFYQVNWEDDDTLYVRFTSWEGSEYKNNHNQGLLIDFDQDNKSFFWRIQKMKDGTTYKFPLDDAEEISNLLEHHQARIKKIYKEIDWPLLWQAGAAGPLGKDGYIPITKESLLPALDKYHQLVKQNDN